jgi:uncharacterized protein YxjI
MKSLYLKQKVFSFRDDYQVFDEHQHVQYLAKGRLFSLRSRKEIFLPESTTPLYTILQAVIAVSPTYFLYDKNQVEVAKFSQQLLSFFGTKFHLVVHKKRYYIQGDIFGLTYMINDEQGTLVEIKKKWLSWGDTYHIMIHDRFETTLAISVVLMIDDFIADRIRGQEVSRRRNG